MVEVALFDVLKNSYFTFLFQVGNRKSLESSLRQLEREKALLQHKSLESHRKAESEADRKRCLENEGERRNMHYFTWVFSVTNSRNVAPKCLIGGMSSGRGAEKWRVLGSSTDVGKNVEDLLVVEEGASTSPEHCGGTKPCKELVTPPGVIPCRRLYVVSAPSPWPQKGLKKKC